MNEISLQDVILFRHLSPEKLEEVKSALEVRRLETGEVLFNMGDPGDEMYIVQQGRVAIYAPSKENSGQEKPIRIFRDGGIFGEMALIDQLPRSLSARAMEPTWVMVLRGNDFRRLLREDPDLAFAIMISLNDRIRYTTEFLNEVRGWVGRVSQGEYGREDFLNEVRGWVKSVTEGDYQQTIEPTAAKATPHDSTVATLAAEFAQMASQVRQREEELRQEIAQLKVEIDDSKRRQDVAQITSSDYFQSLKAQIKSMRDSQDEEQVDS
jgi:CRP/FNR family transcriptional regulator, cyclic AMP receptor protein